MKTVREKLEKYLEGASKQNEDVLEFHQQDYMTLTMNILNTIEPMKVKRLETRTTDLEE